MKMNHFILVVLGVTAIVILTVLTCTAGKTFTWTPTYEEQDKEPYGSFVFDSIMHQSVKKGYEVSQLTADSLATDTNYSQHTILVVRNTIDLDLPKMMEFVKKGGSIVVCACSFSHDLNEGWNAEILKQYYYDLQPPKDVFIHVRYPKDKTYPARNYIVSAPIGNYRFTDYYSSIYEDQIYENKYNLNWTEKVLLGGQEGWAMVKTADYGKGTIAICSMPLLFTNYGILENDNYNLIMRILSLAGNKPIVRTRKDITFKVENNDGNRGDGGGEDSNQDSWMKHILSNTPLRVAFNLMLLGFLLFCIFSAKRKQRVIPVIKPKQNGQLGFIKQIGSLHKRKNATDHIIRTEYRVLSENVKRKARVDITDTGSRNEAIQRIAALTGLQENEIEQTLSTMDAYFQERIRAKEVAGNDVMKEKGNLSWTEEMIEIKIMQKLQRTSESRMVRLIDLMNNIDKKL